MRQVLVLILRVALSITLAANASALSAQTVASFAIPASTPATSAAPEVDLAATLKELQKRQDQIKQQALSPAIREARLTALGEESQRLADDVDLFLTKSLQPERAKLNAELDVLGAAPASPGNAEAPDVAKQRSALAAQQAQLDADLEQAGNIKETVANVRAEIAHLVHDRLKDQLALRSGSIIGASFWAPVLEPEPTDYQRLQAFGAQIGGQLQSVWQPGQRVETTLILLLALSLCTIGAGQLERFLALVCLRRLPDGRLRRSALAVSITLASMLSVACAIQLICFTVTRQQPLTPTLQGFVDDLIKGTLTCALIAALGRALLSTRHPSWRLPAIADPVARAISPFPRILAGLLMFAGAVEQINRTVDTSVQLTLFGRGLVALVVALTVGAALLRANRVRAALAAAGEPPEGRSTVTGAIHAPVSLAVTASLLALLAGYISIARFITYELVWFQLVLCSAYILTKLTHDICERVFSVRHASGTTIKHLFGLQDVHLELASSVLSAIGRSMLLVASVVALLTGGFGTTPTDIINSILQVFGVERLRMLNSVPDHIFNAILTFGVGLYLVRTVRRWLDHDFLPKTGMAAGMRASVLTLFVNIGYVLSAVLTVSVLGIKWSSLAWIVSALSVGIGFGLQEIVKNFISGLILLTERPVKVGDMVSISGVEGDIRRINVRATEIQLADRSTVIVPNSQLISQHVRNVTMGNSTQGVATLTLTFPLHIDPEQVRDLLVGAYMNNPSILDHPAPSVMFSQLTSSGITLSVTGYVRSPRITADVKSDLLFEILKRLRAAAVPLSNPQTVTVVRGLPEADFGANASHYTADEEFHDEDRARNMMF